MPLRRAKACVKALPSSNSGVIGCLAVVMIPGLLFLAAAWFGPPWGMGHWHGLNVLFSRDLVDTTGTVIRNEGAGSSKARLRAPVVRFPLGKGSLVFYGQGSTFSDDNVGDRVPVAYRKSDPETAYIRSFDAEYMTPLMMILFASPFMLFGVRGVYVLAQDRAKRTAAR